MNYISSMRCAVLKAGTLALSHFRGDMKVFTKKDGSMVTSVDMAIELLLKEELSNIVPGAGFCAEESGIVQGNEFVWVIDPIDGTKNFARGLPYFCISVALVQNQQIIAAVTYAPVLNDMFYAQLGSGAWLNDKQLFLQEKQKHEGGILGVTSQSYMRKQELLHSIQACCAATLKSSIRFRVCGAAALDLAYVAAGMFDIALFGQLQWWDMAAGILLVREAGGLVSQHDGESVMQTSRSLIAGNRVVYKLILPVFADKK